MRIFAPGLAKCPVPTLDAQKKHLFLLSNRLAGIVALCLGGGEQLIYGSAILWLYHQRLAERLGTGKSRQHYKFGRRLRKGYREDSCRQQIYGYFFDVGCSGESQGQVERTLLEW
jgi:hypothetical protein